MEIELENEDNTLSDSPLLDKDHQNTKFEIIKYLINYFPNNNIVLD